MPEVVLAAIVLGITLAFMVGPVFLLLLETAITKGVKKALVFDLGVILADIVFILAIVLSSSILGQLADVSWVYTVGGLVLIGYGIYNLRNAARKKVHLLKLKELPASKPVSTGLYAVKGFFLNFLNAGVLGYWLATVVVMGASVDHDPKLMTVYFAVTLATYFTVDVIKVFSARKLKPLLTDHTFIRIERILGLVLIAFGLLMITRGILMARGVDWFAVAQG